jgi:hypothetical protein
MWFKKKLINVKVTGRAGLVYEESGKTMNIEQLKTQLNYLVDKYVSNSDTRIELKALIERKGLPPVKGIMAELVSTGVRIESEDAEIIKDMAFNYM